MKEKMFCFQCQETCRNTGCTLTGMCGKTAETANVMDELIRQLQLIALNRESGLKLGRFICRSLFMTLTNVNFDREALQRQLAQASALAQEAGSSISAGVIPDKNADVISLRALLLYGVKGIAAYAEHAFALGKEDESVYRFIFKALRSTATETSTDKLFALTLEAGAAAVKVMALLDGANTAKFGKPQQLRIKTGTGNRPGILVSGHDLLDLQELLEQTTDANIDIYTHGEMLPAHCYPGLKKYPHLYGNYGNSWHLQHLEFASFNGPILITSNCITPVQKSYSKRIFTTGAAGYPGVPHIPDRVNGKPKDFSQIIALAQKSAPPEELESSTITAGFGHASLFACTGKIVEAIESGEIKSLVVMAGCDGRHREREYYTRIARSLPRDTVILTAGCAKYRYNKIITDTVNGIPRAVDAGQCNDCYSLVLFILKLKEIFGVSDVNDLPVYFDISWYEQKAVAVLLALLHLGFRNIRLGPTLPAFLSPAVAAELMHNFGIKSISTPKADIKAMISGE